MSSVDQKCCSEVLLRTVDEKFGSEVLLISVNQKCGSAVLLKLSIRSVNQKCGSMLKSVDQKKCRSDVLLRSVDQKKCRSEVLLRSVDQKKCGSEVLIRCRSDVSLRSLVRAGKSQLCCAGLVREVQVSSSSWKIATFFSTSVAREVQVSGKSQL